MSGNLPLGDKTTPDATTQPDPIAPPPSAPPPPPSPPSNEVVSQGGVPTQAVIAGPPTHVFWRADGPEFVHPGGFDAAEIEALPDGFWDLPMTADPVAKTFSPDLDAARATIKAKVDARLAAAFGVGYVATVGALAGQRLQVRDDTDRTNWLTSQAAYSAQVSAGNGATAGANFRTETNATITLTFAEGLQELLNMAAWGASIMAVSWSLKDAAAASSDAATILAIDVEGAAWPS